MSSINCTRARSMSASAPFSTTNREPDKRPARAKSISPSRSPIASCGSGATPGSQSGGKCCGSPLRRSTRFAVSSAPSGTSSAGKFGNPARISSISARKRAASAAAPASASRSAALCRNRLSTASPRALAAPTSRPRRLRRACASWARVAAARQSRSSARTAPAAGGSPRRASPRSNSAGWSRSQRRSCITAAI